MRRSNYHKRKKQKSKTKPVWLFKLSIPLIILLVIFIFFRLTTRYWNGKNKIAFSYLETSGNVGITILDPKLSEETTLIIPGDTQVNVARNYGTLRIKNVWQLSQNEHLGGDLLSETLRNNFLFPNFLWAQRDLGNPWQFVFSPGKTNISLGDRIEMAIFAVKVQPLDKTSIDLGENRYLKKEKLSDGLVGYTPSGPVSGRLTVYFADNNLTSGDIKINLVDLTGFPQVANNVGDILEVIGGKVVSIDKKSADPNLDCEIDGKNREMLNRVSQVFSCKVTGAKTDFDLEMRMGEKFAKRF